MPAKSAAQKRLMDAAAHNPAFAKKVGIPTKVAKEFSTASKGQTFMKGGEMKYAKGGSVKPSPMGKVTSGGKRAHGEHTVQQKGHTKGKQVVMKKGGMTKGKC